MKAYLDMLKHIKDKGILKPNRTGVGAYTVAGYMFQHDMAEGFPLVTTKKMATKTMRVELEGFIKGITDKSWYKERGCNIWNEWCNPEAVPYVNKDADNYEAQQKDMADCNDLGVIYGYQWRNFNGDHTVKYKFREDVTIPELWMGGDQLRAIVNTLKTNPSDRRMVCSAWNPLALHKQALPPCHVLWHVTVIGDTLNLCWFQRSCDAFLGVPFNIASYASLLVLLSAEAGLNPGKLTGFLSDLHIYENHRGQVEEQLGREPMKLPTATLSPEFNGVLNWSHDMLTFPDYESHPAIKASIAI